MIITTLLVYQVARLRWHWSRSARCWHSARSC
ncbi:MAG: hypothetical protein IPG34_17995 [Rhodocyclaceae bacterium]|nr:hypothetical protein [Rhodocyclaceae bacterium]